MQGLVELDTISELSLALLGFSALVAMFRGGSLHTWEPRPRLAFWVIVTYCLGSLIFSLLPSLLRDLGASSWSSLIAALALFHLAAIAAFLRRHVRLTATGYHTPNVATWAVGILVGGSAFFLLLWGLAGGFGVASYGIYHAGVVACLIQAALGFVGVLRFYRPAA